jgi:hypothetical protein
MEAYCVKCKAKREMKDTKEITMKNGRPATQGVSQPAEPRCSGSARANKAAAQASLSNLININRYANRKTLPFVSTCGAMRSFKNFMLN